MPQISAQVQMTAKWQNLLLDYVQVISLKLNLANHSLSTKKRLILE